MSLLCEHPSASAAATLAGAAQWASRGQFLSVAGPASAHTATFPSLPLQPGVPAHPGLLSALGSSPCLAGPSIVSLDAAAPGFPWLRDLLCLSPLCSFSPWPLGACSPISRWSHSSPCLEMSFRYWWLSNLSLYWPFPAPRHIDLSWHLHWITPRVTGQTHCSSCSLCVPQLRQQHPAHLAMSLSLCLSLFLLTAQSYGTKWKAKHTGCFLFPEEVLEVEHRLPMFIQPVFRGKIRTIYLYYTEIPLSFIGFCLIVYFFLFQYY